LLPSSATIWIRPLASSGDHVTSKAEPAGIFAGALSVVSAETGVAAQQAAAKTNDAAWIRKYVMPAV
jgi:hypothetical protein